MMVVHVVLLHVVRRLRHIRVTAGHLFAIYSLCFHIIEAIITVSSSDTRDASIRVSLLLSKRPTTMNLDICA
ncbi:hypothetical protein V8C37DRAFT_367050 [Trichoderma ceciliae]